MSDIQYKKLASASMQGKKSLVISECSKGGYTLAQQVTYTDEYNKNTNLYLKGAIHISNVEGLISLRDAINVALGRIEKN